MTFDSVEHLRPANVHLRDDTRSKSFIATTLDTSNMRNLFVQPESKSLMKFDPDVSESAEQSKYQQAMQRLCKNQGGS